MRYIDKLSRRCRHVHISSNFKPYMPLLLVTNCTAFRKSGEQENIAKEIHFFSDYAYNCSILFFTVMYVKTCFYALYNMLREY